MINLVSDGINLGSVYEVGKKWCLDQGSDFWAISGLRGQKLTEKSIFLKKLTFIRSYGPVVRFNISISFKSIKYHPDLLIFRFVSSKNRSDSDSEFWAKSVLRGRHFDRKVGFYREIDIQTVL